MSALAEDKKAYYELFRKELQTQLKRAFRQKRHLYKFADENNIKMPYGIDKASSIMFIAEHLARMEMKQKYNDTYDEEFQKAYKEMTDEDKMTKTVHMVGSATVETVDEKGNMVKKTLPRVSVIRSKKEEKKEEATELKTIKEQQACM